MNSQDSLKARIKELATRPAIKAIQDALGSAQLYLVGGSLRELASHTQVPTDIDLATNLEPTSLLSQLEAAGLRVIATGIEHGTVTVVHDSQHIEITTFRLPGPRNQAKFSNSIEIDLQGRDFTINALAFCLHTEELLDPFNGLQDIEHNRLKSVGKAEDRILEDPLRMLRAIRFGPAQGRTLDPELKSTIEKHSELLSSVSVERIQSEFNQILVSENAGAGLRMCEQTGLLPHLLPELVPAVNFEQNEFHNEDVFSHTLTVVDRAEKDLRLRLAALFHDSGKPDTLSVDEEGRRHFYKHEQKSEEHAKNWLERMRYSKSMTQEVSKLAALHMRPLECGPSGVRRIIRDTGDLFETWLALKRADKSPTIDQDVFDKSYNMFLEMVEEERQRPVGSPFAALAVNGDDLKQLGMNEGKAIGTMLSELQEIVLEKPELNEKETLLEEARRILSS